MEEYWDQGSNREEDVFTGPSVHNTFIRVNGSDVPVTVGSSFSEVVLDVAKTAGLGKFRLSLNGRDIQPNEAPDNFSEGDKVDLRPYEVAGLTR